MSYATPTANWAAGAALELQERISRLNPYPNQNWSFATSITLTPCLIKLLERYGGYPHESRPRSITLFSFADVSYTSFLTISIMSVYERLDVSTSLR